MTRLFDARAESIEAMLTGAFGLGGGAIATVGFVCTGTTMSVRSQQGAQAVITAARVNPALMRILVKMTEANAYTPLILFAGTIMVAAAIDVGAVSIDNFLPRQIMPDIVAMVENARRQQEAQRPAVVPEPEANGTSPQYQHAFTDNAAGSGDA